MQAALPAPRPLAFDQRGVLGTTGIGPRRAIGHYTKLFAAAVVFAMAMMSAARPVAAQCVQSGTSVACSGTVVNQGSAISGFGDGTQNGLTINVVSGASVTGMATFSPRGLWLGSDNTIDNAGTIAAISTSAGSNPIAIYGQSGPLTVVNSGSITISSTATIASGNVIRSNGDLNLDNSGIITNNTTSGAFGGDVFAQSGNAIVINSGQIIGNFQGGIFADGFVNVTNNANSTIAGTIAIEAGSGGSSVFNAGTITGTGGTAIMFAGAGNTLTLAPTFVINGNVLGTGADTFQLGGTGNGTFNLNQIGPAAQYQGFATFNVIGGVWTLNNTFGQTQTWNIDNGGVAVLNGTLPGVNVNAGGILGGTGVVTGTVTNAGTVEPGFGLGNGTFANLTVGTYVGAGGTLALRTVLGGDNSPTDRLTVNGNVSGATTPIFITNVGGQGAETVNGIEVVAVGGTSPANAFRLANPELRAGEFDYRLFQGAPDPTASSWFLRSTFIVPPGGGEEEMDTSPPPEPLPPGVYPIIGPELATYGVVQPTARQLGLATLGTLNQRIGDTMTLANAGPDTTGWSRSEWGRFFGQQVSDHYQAFADPRSSGWLGGFQGGLDLWRGELLPGLLPGRDAAGVYFAYGHSNVDVTGLVTNPQATGYILTHTGMVGMDAFSSAAYWTHYSPSGWYLDAVVQGSVYTVNATTQFAALKTDGYGFVSSLEAGYPIALPFFGPHFVLEPQGQIIWQQIGFGSANDGLGQVGLGTTSGFTGRLGVRGQWNIPGYGATLWQPYLGVNFWRDWGAAATTTFGIDPVSLFEQATRTETFGGVTVKFGDHLSAYTQAGYQFAMEQTFYGIQRDGVHGDVGLRFTW